MTPLDQTGDGRFASEDANSKAALFEYAELLFFAYRDFTSDPDALLAQDGFGRAHHRVLHFVTRYPGMRVANLLEILNITKQSLGRVLKQLIERGFIEQQAGDSDRRERRLFVTPDGQVLAERLAAPQLARLARALPATSDGKAAVRTFLAAMKTQAGDPLALAGEENGGTRRSDDTSQRFAGRAAG